MTADSWTTLETFYGSGSEWICPLFPGSAPAVAAPAGQPVIPPVPTTPIRLAYLVMERTTTGGTLVSWNSLDDHSSKRMLLSGITLDPVWDEFDVPYFNQHGNYFYALSPRLGSPVTFTASSVTLGTLDAAMIADFTSHLSEITANIANSVAMAALYSHQPAPSGDRRFYRIAADWSVDSDGDGRLDWEELVLDGNNPFATDSDGDGTPDQAGTGPGGSSSGYPTPTNAQEPTPYAAIEQETFGVHTVISPSSIPGEEPSVSVYGQYSSPPGSDYDLFESASTYGSLKQALDSYSDPILHWNAAFDEFECENSTSTYQGEISSSSSRYSRARFRLKLDKPAPEGGYQIPLRLAVVYQSINPETHIASFMSTPVGMQDHIDLTLQCAEHQTEGTPVDVRGPASLALNSRVIFMPIKVFTQGPDIASTNPQIPGPLPGEVPADGTCVTSEEPFVVDCYNPKIRIPLWNYDEPPLEIHWMKRKLNGGGTLDNWTPIYDPIVDPNYPLEPVILRGAHKTVYGMHDGIYQLKAVLFLPDATMIDFPFVRMKNSRSIVNGEGRANSLLKAGQPDYFGICANPLSKAVREGAVTWLGDTGYAFVKDVDTEADNPRNPSTYNSSKCNIFVTHVSITAGANTPFFVRIGRQRGSVLPSLGVPAAPIARDDWYFEPEMNVDLDVCGWNSLDVAESPSPGMSVASPRTSAGTRHGHVGILDYDGTWINAGTKSVNKSVHLLDTLPDYKPNTMRTR